MKLWRRAAFMTCAGSLTSQFVKRELLMPVALATGRTVSSRSNLTATEHLSACSNLALDPPGRHAQRGQLAAGSQHRFDVLVGVVDQDQDRALGPLR